MKYKTVIEVTTEANNPYEAADIAGEYLRGSLETGITMVCRTKPDRLFGKQIVTLISVALFLSAFASASVLFGNQLSVNRSAKLSINCDETGLAVQPPLRTENYTKISEKFRTIWSLKRKELILKELPAAR